MQGENFTKPTVQFNVNGSRSQPRLNSGQSMIPRGILQNKSNKNYDILDLEQHGDYGKISQLPPRRSRSTTPSRGSRPRSFEMLPFISQIPKSVARTSSMRHSSNDVRFASKSAGSKPPINPRSTQKGVLRVVSSAQNSPSRIPRRKSIVSSMDELNRRESSISPDRNFKRAVSMPRRSSRNISPVTKDGNTKSEFVKSPRRILKPTTLSPILGTPNKDSDASESQPKTEKSPSKIPLTVLTVARLTTKMSSKSISRELSPSKSHLNSKSNSRVSSRDPSPSKSHLNSRSNSRVGSRDPSPSKQKIDKIINVKKIETKKPKTTPITVSRSLTRTAPKKTIESTKNDLSLKRTSTIKKSVSSTAVDKTKSSGLKKTSSFRNENPEKAKKEGSSTKKEPSTLKKEPSNLKREPSNLKKEPPITRENSNLKKELGNLKRESSSQKIPSVLSKRKSEENMMKKLEKKNSFRNEKIEEGEKSKEEPEKDKFEKLIPMTKNNVVSMTTAAITAQPVQITTTLTNQIPLGKSQSSGHLLKQPVEKQEEEGNTSVVSDSILEKAQKLNEDVQKTVSDTKTVVKDITSDIKKVESDLNKNVVAEEAPIAQKKLPAPVEKRDSFKSVNEKSLKKSDTKNDINNGKKTPVPTKVIEKDTKDNQMVAQPAVEADVSVVQNTKGSTSDDSSANNIHPIKNKGNDMVEQVSVSSISVPPDVELESGNKNIGMDRKSMEEKPINDFAESVLEDDR